MEKGRSSAALHADNLLEHLEYLRPLRSPSTCLCCIQRKSEHVFECGHALCDICVAIFGDTVEGLEYCFEMPTCLLCRLGSSLNVRLLPPTCSARLLSVDGGGSRGIVPITFLDTLQEVLGLPYPIQHHFDFAIGTSSGGLIVLAMFTRLWGTKRCLEFFKIFAKRIFPYSGSRGSLFGRIRRFFQCFLTNERYDTLSLEATLQEAFGLGPLFGSGQLSGMKVAVTATTISDATLCLFSNYNGLAIKGGDFRTYPRVSLSD